MARPKTYHIMLSDSEVAVLCKAIRDKRICKIVLKRCQGITAYASRRQSENRF